MKNLLIIFSFFFIFFIGGCANIMAPDHHLAALENLDQKNIENEINQYNTAVLQKASIISSTVFTFRGKSMSAIGITKLDSKNKNFLVAGFNPMGITLFKIKMENSEVISSYVIPQFGKGNLDQAVTMISKDIGRIYFNRKLPFQNNGVKLDKNKVVIKRRIDNNDYQYIFGGNPLKLVTKSMYENKTRVWSVDYYDYKIVGQDSKFREIPFKIFLKNYKYGYTLEIETKKIETK